MDYKKILKSIHREVKPILPEGRVFDVIPALASVPISKFGMAVKTVEGDEYFVGDAMESFSIQSISKVFTLILAMKHQGDGFWGRVGREASGNPFNSLVQLEYEHGIPRNPFINAGALVITDCVISEAIEAKSAILNFVKFLSGSQTLQYSFEVARSEKENGYRNAALANFMKSFGNIHNDKDELLDTYYHQCALFMSCLDLTRAFLPLANNGMPLNAKKAIITKSQTKKINSLMLTCGFYDAVGDFAYRVGLPGKSGVGGGIVAVIPNVLSVCVWSPGLDSHGNSLAGTKALELFTTKTGLSIF